MDLITNTIKQKIQNLILENLFKKKINETEKYIAEVLDILYENIPDNKRISYGAYYIIKVLSKFIYEGLGNKKELVYQSLEHVLELNRDYRVSCVCLGILSWYANENSTYIKKIVPFFKDSAIDEDWKMRETSAGFFHSMIKHHPEIMKSYLEIFSTDLNPKLRRFASETLRPVAENRWIQKKPDYSLSILRGMFTESSAYPRTSVGNNLSDLARKNPDLIFDIVKDLVQSGNKNSYWIPYRTCRNLVKKKPIKVMDLLLVDEYKYKKNRYKRIDYI